MGNLYSVDSTTGAITTVGPITSTGSFAVGTLTVVDYTALSGASFTINGVTLSEPGDWQATTDNTTTAASITNAINGSPTLSVIIFADNASSPVVTITALEKGEHGDYTLVSSDDVNLHASGATLTGGLGDVTFPAEIKGGAHGSLKFVPFDSSSPVILRNSGDTVSAFSFDTENSQLNINGQDATLIEFNFNAPDDSGNGAAIFFNNGDNSVTFSQIETDGTGLLTLQSRPVTGSITIATNTDTSAYTWAFAADGSLTVPVLTSAPSSPVAGQIYFDSTVPSGTATGSLQLYDGTSWHTIVTT